MKDLKPCPLCDGVSQRYMNRHKHNVGCTKCTATIKGYDTQAEATAAWNTRLWVSVDTKPKSYGNHLCVVEYSNTPKMVWFDKTDKWCDSNVLLWQHIELPETE